MRQIRNFKGLLFNQIDVSSSLFSESVSNDGIFLLAVATSESFISAVITPGSFLPSANILPQGSIIKECP